MHFHSLRPSQLLDIDNAAAIRDQPLTVEKTASPAAAPTVKNGLYSFGGIVDCQNG
jgi:hypothetical protein